MAALVTADETAITADADTVTADLGAPPPAGWPCGLLSDAAPSVLDRESAPTADDLLPQILALTPRGPAWGTDEVGDGRGASPVQRTFWRALAAWAADHLAREFTAATQALPSALTYTLQDWETELGLPDACLPVGTLDQRKAAVRARFGARGDVSPAWFVCLAASLGYPVTIEQPTQFLCGVSQCGGPDMVAGSYPEETHFACGEHQCGLDPISGMSLDNPSGSIWKFWIVHIPKQGPDTFLIAGDGQCGRDPVSGFGQAFDLECLLRSLAPPQTRVLFSYA